jgi:hypothetical protein
MSLPDRDVSLSYLKFTFKYLRNLTYMGKRSRKGREREKI